MKRKIALLAVVAIALSLVAYGTVAYFSATGTAHNVLTMGNIKIALADMTTVTEDNEQTEVDFNTVYPKGMLVMPATKASKIVYVTNTGDNPCYVRVAVDKKVVSANSEAELNTDGVLINFNTTDWVLGKDEGAEYWYYTKKLEPAESTTKLFTEVEFDKEIGNDYMNTTFTVSVSAQAVQSDNNEFSETESVLDVVGWPK